jgi:hypothetical protein
MIAQTDATDAANMAWMFIKELVEYQSTKPVT